MDGMSRSCLCFFCVALAVSMAQGPQPVPRVQPQVLARAVGDGRVTVVYLAPRYATAVRMPEAINSVVVGDPASFSAEHSQQEPNLVFVKPITTKPAQTNLLIATAHGHQASLLLISRGELSTEQQPAVDFVLRYKPAGRFLIEPTDYPTALVAETASLGEEHAAQVLPAKVVPAATTRRQRRTWCKPVSSSPVSYPRYICYMTLSEHMREKEFAVMRLPFTTSSFARAIPPAASGGRSRVPTCFDILPTTSHVLGGILSFDSYS
jgi:hypothetical protein